MGPTRSPQLRSLRTRHGAAVLVAALAAALVPAARAAKPATPSLQIPLEATGYMPVSAINLAAGHTMFTLNYVDEQHLLLTYHTHALMPRLEDATPDDDDRYVAAVLMELPSGKIVARCQWRTRDHDRYLWALGQGRFLLRVRTRLVLLNPLANLPDGEAFRELPFADVKRRIGLIDVAPDGELITVETVPPRKPPLTGAAASAAALARTQPGNHAAVAEPGAAGSEYMLHFYRLLNAEGHKPDAKPSDAATKDKFVLAAAGVVRSRSLVRVALTSAGYLTTARESSGVYLFDFHTHTGKKLELSPYETTCVPHAFFTSPQDFIAFGCRGGEDKLELSAFNMRGEEPWVSVLAGQQLSASVVPAPAAGRFAFERTLAGTAGDPAYSAGTITNAQEITVYQHHDGRVLLRTQSNPVQLSGQNYDLSPNGLSLATIQNGNIAIYQLPGLTDKDRKEMARAQASAPEDSLAMVRLNASPVVEEKESTSPLEQSTSSEPPSPGKLAAAPPATVAAGPTPPAPHVIENGDAQPKVDAEPRRPPTLYDPGHPKAPN